MKIFFTISLILLLWLVDLPSIPLAQASTLVTSSNQNLETSDFLEVACFSEVRVESLAKCKDLITQDQSNSEAWNQLGLIYYSLESYQRAYLSFKYATSLRTDYTLAWTNMCAALSQLQNYEAALDACNKSLSFASTSEDSINEKVLTWNNKAIVLYFLGRYQESLEALETALALNPDDSQAIFNHHVVQSLIHALTHMNRSEDKEFTL